MGDLPERNIRHPFPFFCDIDKADCLPVHLRLLASVCVCLNIGDRILRLKMASCRKAFGKPNDCFKQIYELMFSGIACNRNAIFFEAKC